MFCLLSLFSLAHAAEEGEKERPFLERTVIGYPNTIGDYTLEHARFDEKLFGNGVALRYAAGVAPLRLDVFVYPLGRVQPDVALADGMAEIEASIRAVERAGDYRDVRFGEIVDFPVPWTDGPVTPEPITADPDDDAAESARVLALIGDTGAPRTIIGRRRGMQMLQDGEPLQSLSYLFYRQLYLVKVRASAPLAAGSQPAFEAAVDRAVTTLVPALRIANTGGCGKPVIEVPMQASDQEREDAVFRGLGAEMARIKREGCDLEAATLPAGYGTQAIEFPSDIWRSE